MSNENKKAEMPNLDKFTEAKPIDATITFDIPAYQDRDGVKFRRVLVVPTKKAYAIFKNATKKFVPVEAEAEKKPE